MKTWFGICGAALLAAGCATNDDMPAAEVQAAPPPGAAPMGMTVSDMTRNFVMMASSSDMFEIQSSQAALQMSQNPMVREFAQMMITDHSALSSQLAPVAASLGLDPRAMGMAPHHMRMVNEVRSAGSGPAFDTAYHRAQLMGHQEALNLHRTYAASGDNPQLRQLAAGAVPIIERHLSHLQMHGNHMMQPAPRRAGERG